MQFNTLSQLGSSLHANPIIDPIANKTVNVSESALDSIKKMAQELQEERDELLEKLTALVNAVMQKSGAAGVDDLFSACNKASELVAKLGKCA